MDPLLGINANSTLASVSNTSSVNPLVGLLTAGLGYPAPGAFGGSSSVVGLSGLGQLLSAASTFQDSLQSLKPGTATSGGGQNFGTDFASLAAEAQSFVDTFNNLQSSITNINGTSNQLGGSVAGATGLAQSLNTQALTTISNGNSTLTRLSQLGIEFTPSSTAGGGGTLSLNLATLQSAFNTEKAGAFSLLSNAASSFGEVAGGFINQSSRQYSTLSALAQSSAGIATLTGSLSPAAQSNSDLFNFLTTQSLTGGIGLQQVVFALNQYSLVAGLLG